MPSCDSLPRRPRRVAVLGVGAMGSRHARVLAGLPDVYSLVGVFDADPAVARAVGAACGVRAFEDEAACLAAAEVVVVASPIEAHASAARRAIERGRHLLVEKPLCETLAEASALVRLAAKRGTRLFVGHSERHNPVIAALARLVRPGDVRELVLRRVAPGLARREQGVLLSLGVHDLDLAAHLTGSALSLLEVSGVVRREGESRAELTLSSRSGAVARLVADREATRRERTIVLATANDVFEGDLLTPCLVRRPRGSGAAEAIELPSTEPLVAQALAMAAAVDGAEGTRIATGADGARALALALQARDELLVARRRVG